MPRSTRASFTMITNPIPGRMARLKVGMPAVIDKAVQYEANESQNWMRNNAPWTDRTGNARQGLFARSFRRVSGWTIVLYHSVSYGIWLEIAMDRKYKIIEPAWRRCGQNVMSSLSHIMRAV
jgi:hypothetical protein